MPPIPDTGWVTPTQFPNLSCARVISIDVETYDPELYDHGPGWARGKGHIAGFSVGADEDGRWYFPIRHEVEPEFNLDPQHALAWARDTLSNPDQAKVGANIIYDVGWLAHEGVPIRGELLDVQFAEALLEERGHVALEILAQKYLGEGKTTDVLKKWIMDYYVPPKDQWRREIYRSPPRLAGPYGEGDANLPIKLLPHLYERLWREGLVDLFRMECASIPMLVAMRFAGVRVNLSAAEELSNELETRAKAEQARLDELAGLHVDINSNPSLTRLFDRVGLKYPRTEPTAKHPNGQPSFKKDYLKKLEHPVAKSINEIRRLEKLKGTFVDGYIIGSHVNSKLYCSFHPLRSDEGGTRSGRYSSSDPNLQNIPIRDPELGKKIRALFIPDEGHERWCKFDYSQIEYRFLVHYAIGPGSDEARQLFIGDPNTDYHEMVRQLVYQRTGQLLDRRPIKNLNFGLVFGMGEEKLANDLNLTRSKAKEFFETYHTGVPYVRPTMRANMDEASTTGIITTILGRKSRFDLWEPGEYGNHGVALPHEQAILRYGRIKRAYVHKALNRRLQGSAADLMKLAMLRCWQDGVFAETGVPRITVHDELDFSDPGGKDEAFEEVRRIMETCLSIRIPIRADCDVGTNWGTAEPVKSGSQANASK
jgi:DNA polymerase I-like protein with 3'-5' exonuclease and polymerase domains